MTEAKTSECYVSKYLLTHDFSTIAVQSHTVYGNTNERYYYIKYRETKFTDTRKTDVEYEKEKVDPYTRHDLLLFDPSSAVLLDRYDAQNPNHDDVDSEEAEWEIDKIVGDQIRDGSLEYYVLWKPVGDDPAEYTWEHHSNVEHCTDVLNRYHKIKQQRIRQRHKRRMALFESSSDSDSDYRPTGSSGSAKRADVRRDEPDAKSESDDERRRTKHDRNQRKGLNRKRNHHQMESDDDDSDSSSDSTMTIGQRKKSNPPKNTSPAIEISSDSSESDNNRIIAPTVIPQSKRNPTISLHRIPNKKKKNAKHMRKQSHKIRNEPRKKRRKKKSGLTVDSAQAQLATLNCGADSSARVRISKLPGVKSVNSGVFKDFMNPSHRTKNRHYYPICNVSRSSVNTGSSSQNTAMGRKTNPEVRRQMRDLIRPSDRSGSAQSSASSSSTSSSSSSNHKNGLPAHRIYPIQPPFTIHNLFVTDSDIRLPPFIFDYPLIDPVCFDDMPELEKVSCHVDQ